MAVIFGAQMLAPLGTMPNGQNVGGGGGACSGFFQVSLCVCEPRTSPRSDLKWGGERGAGLPATLG